jgi:predicted glycoside hydrolase/deacetylase ChbG (UPF0249 family)
MPRRLLITADDFGIGPETSRGILDLAALGAITSTVLLVNSPYAEESVRQWNERGRPVELGWHPCLTLDAPVSKPGDVPTLVDDSGQFLKLGSLLKKLLLKRVDANHIELEFQAQLRRFRDLVGFEAQNVNGHHHVHIFEPVTMALMNVLKDSKPYLRRVIEPRQTLMKVRGARLKRLILSRFGKRMRKDLPGNEALLGITDPLFVHDVNFFANWLRHSRGDVLELTCHPGHLDATLAGRDGSFEDGQLHRRAAEFARLSDPAFLDCVLACGFKRVTADRIIRGLLSMAA